MKFTVETHIGTRSYRSDSRNENSRERVRSLVRLSGEILHCLECRPLRSPSYLLGYLRRRPRSPSRETERDIRESQINDRCAREHAKDRKFRTRASIRSALIDSLGIR